MKNQMKKTIALLLVLVQFIALLPLGMTTAKAVDTQSGQSPVLNETIVGTVKFQSFNFLGDNAAGEDGTDYTTTFYYSDDYFSPSAINSAASSRTMLWSDLDNPSLATCSMDFAVAAMTSADGDVVSPSSRTWDNSDYSAARKEKNVRDFLSACGFTDVECTELDKRPRNDSIGYTIGSKKITVWNADTQKNEEYTLIAVGVRGAGYGQEWASNISIGDPATGAMPTNGRHWGFDDGAKKVCSAIRTYLSAHSITGSVKYWITGFSRAAAVANLAAGYLTDNTAAYRTAARRTNGAPDVYAYTWECPQAASTRENALNYKNIHNILNPMDAVPKVSPDEFEHQRLGVDYQMPYHGTPNLSSANHTAMYNRMFEVLKTIAVGNGTDPDPLVDDKTTNAANDGYVSPNKYPYNKAMTIYKMDAGELMGQVVNYGLGIDTDTLMKEFGTVEAEQKHRPFLITYGNVDSLLGWNGGSDYKTTTWYLDDFIDNLVDIFLTSNAWVGGTGTGRTALQNRTTFISNYQNDFRTLFGYFLDLAGPAFLDLIPKLIDAVTDNIGTSLTSGFAWYFVRFYNDPSNTSKKNNLINAAKTLAVDVANDMANGFPDPEYQGITKSQMNAAMRNLAELVINLYSYELSEFDSQYLGTTLRYLNTILCTHEQETVLSWIMSLDQNHMNRSCRTITIPAGCDAVIYEFRPEYPQYDGNPTDGVTTAPKVAELTGGVLDSKDDRITLYQENGSYVIRYPASLQLRVDLKPGQTMNLNQIFVDDYQTLSEYVAVSSGKDQFKNKPLASTYQSVTQSSKTNAAATNSQLSAYGTIGTGDTLHVLVDDIAAYNASNTSAYTLSIEKAPKSVVAQYSMETVLAENVSASELPSDAEGFAVNGNGQLVWTGNVGAESKQYENFFADNYSFNEYQLTDLGEASVTTNDSAKSIPTKQTFTVVPATNIYYDDGLLSQQVSTVNAEPNYQAKVEAAEPNELVAASGSQVSFRFTGTRIDVYINTNDKTGFVGAYLLNADGTERYSKDGKVYSKIVSGKSENELKNIPVISYSGMDYDTYTLVIVTPTNKTTKIDGVRIYDDRVTQYLSVRESLLSTSDWTGGDSAVSGSVYLDCGTEGASLAEYTASGPKGEVYLSTGNGVAFQISDYDPNATYRVGLGAVANEEATVEVSDGVGRREHEVTAATHMFYPLQPDVNGYVVIINDGEGLLSVTDLEIVPAVRANRSVLMASPSLMRYAENFSALPLTATDTEAPEETPTPTPDLGALVRQLISSFVSALFGSISRLFGP